MRLQHRKHPRECAVLAVNTALASRNKRPSSSGKGGGGVMWVKRRSKKVTEMKPLIPLPPPKSLVLEGFCCSTVTKTAV